ncbi:MAG: transcription antitermination factor NusB [Clostridiales bacterium]|jgi:N utilization substance protein B|nr:transcription antitermination factor NusB [Clostridiales bacterium]
MNRRLIRQSAFKMLFSYNFNKDCINSYIKEAFEEDNIFFAQDEEDDSKLGKLSDNDKEFFYNLVMGTLENTETIDSLINKSLKSWTMDRIAKVDLTILRMALYEILYSKDVPVSVAINEAVELGKKFGTDDSGSFINGVLGKVVRDFCKQGE